MRITLPLFLLLLFCLLSKLSAQDPHFSQFFANPVYLNPAYAGFNPAPTITINHRDQWFGIPDGKGLPFSGGYRTMNVTADVQIPCIMQSDDANIGLAVSGFRDAAGSAPFITQGFGLAASHEQKLYENRKTDFRRLDLRIGGQLSYLQRSLQSSELIYSFQLDPVDGLIGDFSGLDLQSDMYPNMNVGILLRGMIKTSKYSENLFTLGYSISNINEPNVSLFGAASPVTLSRRTTVYLGTSHRVTVFQGTRAPWYVSPHYRWDRQLDGKLNTHTLGAFVFQKAFYVGAFIQRNLPNAITTNTGQIGDFSSQNTTTLIINPGFDLRSILDLRKPWRKRADGIVLGITYDVNLSGLGQSATSGVIELNLRMRLDRRNRRTDCTALGKFETYRGKCPVLF
jgi:type IX secretion system PorP/SprF family membrane protein